MRLSADVIARSPAFLNPLKDREIDLRGAHPLASRGRLWNKIS